MALVGVQDLAVALGVAKGTVSKRAAAGSIPVADRDKRGHPLFDVEEVRAAWNNNANSLMRRRGADVDPPDGQPSLESGDIDEPTSDDLDERRSVPLPREPTGLNQQMVLERQLRNRRLVRQLGEDEGLFVLKSVADNDVMTLARQTRDGVAAQMADFAGELYAFAATPRTEGELRLWLSEHTGRAFDEVDKALAAEKGDEFGGNDSDASEQPVEANAVAAA